MTVVKIYVSILYYALDINIILECFIISYVFLL